MFLKWQTLQVTLHSVHTHTHTQAINAMLCDQTDFSITKADDNIMTS